MSSKQKSEKRHENYLSYILLTLILGYAVFLLVSSQTQIADKQKEYDSVHSKLTELEEANEQLAHYAADENRVEYMEEIARDKLDYADPRERIYYIVPSS